MKYRYKTEINDNGKPVEILYRKCERCGNDFSAHERKTIYTAKYCSACAKIVKAEQNRERIRRYREKHKK